MMRAGAGAGAEEEGEEEELEVDLPEMLLDVTLLVGRRAKRGLNMAWRALHPAPRIAFQVVQQSCWRDC